ncbi:MAG: pyruvate kinase [Bacteroidetes bacterium GWE2_40_63]|nr:MAG: pyruvate kinase [Bacteroidetes bacterium GWA2_40_14]OFX60918.1 MAG: pyruvate kinase [Bacteroidetes bacterium GWC2_40_13]OFX71601.1 MAG: pyruvate kinase [Bacteroidetes bacterium GWD2_40_43]OFX95642.1 MAG: pyruvate kinase [Bacteroidetes bacterium GWE2_40_63]OFY22298.1 MAG: pyruvate kinase [Bacteroidetes bacterium GWF2_40_13]OFZ24939.1 MAG: pyruvate kinase [Bacteroidetes bacterium RIFOXYC2_FULL_40_12]
MYHNKTKIVATVGPAIASKEMLKKLVEAGVNVFRLNFSHSKHEEHKQVIDYVLEINEELKTNVALLADLQGPKLRIGEVENNSVLLEEGAEIEFVNEKIVGNAQRVYMSYSLFPYDVQVGDTILIDDGKIKLQAVSTNRKNSVKAKVIYGGVLSSKKGVNLPNTHISLPSLTPKDIEDAEFALDNNVDWIALSFVRSVTDIADLKDLIKKRKKHTKVIAKIEKPEALHEIDNIIDVTDAIMVARGDLGVELPFHEVPMMQKMLVEKCIKFAKPVIIATQMMESMISNFSPTRAEANDVANAVIDGASALMLSGETSVGKYPVDVIKSMREIIAYTEQNGYRYYREHSPSVMNHSFIPDSICRTACVMAQQTHAKSIVVLTYSGYTAFRIASHRPYANIYAFTPDKGLVRQMSLLWGTRTFFSDEFLFTNDAIEFSMKHLKENHFIHDHELVVHVGSMPLNKKGQTNMVKLSNL